MRTEIRGMFPIIFSVIIIAAVTLTDPAISAGAGCNYYASPTGAGNGLSSTQAFKIADFWPVAKPGDTLCLLDGTYTGSNSLINPPQGLNGTQSGPITVKAINDGKVTIDGEGSRRPVSLYYNDYFVLEGFNAHSSSTTVVNLSRSNHNVLRRIAAWDSADGNYAIFGVHYGDYNLLEDVAGWGIARKVFSSSQKGNHTTIRRAWGRWEGSHVVGPKQTYTLGYNNYYMICENCIGTWSGERMKETYTLLGYDGQPWTGSGAGTYTNYDVNQPYGIFSNDGFSSSGDKNTHARLLGSIAYVKGIDKFTPDNAVFITKVDSLEVTNSAVYIEPGQYLDKRTFGLFKLSTAVGTGLVAKNLTGIGGKGLFIDGEWQKTSVLSGADIAIYGSGENVYNSVQGAKICDRYKDGVSTTEPLWPWPMNQRILDATAASGRAPVDVTATIEGMFGPIPSECRSDTGAAGSSDTGTTSSGGSSTTSTAATPAPPSNLAAVP